jgi:phospholipase/carboxylesterase
VLKTHIRDSEHQAAGVIIWLHGLGSSAHNMMGLVDALPLTSPVRHVFLDAPVRTVTVNNHMSMPAWYDILGFHATTRQDEVGILASELLIRAVIKEQLDQGFHAKQIFIAGFSQGGAMALFTGFRYNEAVLGGIISLSAYFPLAHQLDSMQVTPEIPIFMGAGSFDPVVPFQWTKQSSEWLKAKGVNQLVLHEYPMEHSICNEEIHDVARWINNQLTYSKQRNGENA